MGKRAAATVVVSLTITCLSTSPATADTRRGDALVLSASINGGKPVVIGTAAQTSFTATVTASDPAGIDYIDPLLYKGSITEPTGYLAAAREPECVVSNAATTRCTWLFMLDQLFLQNTDAGAWRLHVNATAQDGDYQWKDSAASVNIQRVSKLTANASPEPVAKGKPITITGALSRVNWTDSRYHGYANQPVRLQFRTPNGTYSTVKTVTASSTGYLKTTVPASRDGYWRYSYAGNTTTAAVNAPGDLIDVR
ncbi:calcium-binding protein [Streptomyces cinerochromogenes]|uniref:calcium-binding protein n=1 Tax=Streptomyces cinerochromogenes TaxID=66422 RepID=UPI0036C2D66F